MHGLVSLLPAPIHDSVLALWQELEDEHGLHGIHVTPFPHFSWQIGEQVDLPGLKANLEELAAYMPPLRVRTTGLGLFTGPRPVLYIPLVKDSALIELHALLWERTEPFFTQRSPLYRPDAWMPHISLAYEDLGPENIAAVLQSLAGRVFVWEMEIDNLTFVFEPAGETGAIGFSIPLAPYPKP